MNSCTDGVWFSEISWIYLQVLFKSLFCLMKLFKCGDGATF
jgi:hypothetical protein